MFGRQHNVVRKTNTREKTMKGSVVAKSNISSENNSDTASTPDVIETLKAVTVPNQKTETNIDSAPETEENAEKAARFEALMGKLKKNKKAIAGIAVAAALTTAALIKFAIDRSVVDNTNATSESNGADEPVETNEGEDPSS